MFHELSLHAALPHHRHHQILSILAGICSHDPVPLIQRHHIFQPARKPERQVAKQGGSQAVVDAAKVARQAQSTGEVYYLQAVCETEEPEPAKRSEDDVTWSIVWYDIPEAGKKDVTSRAASRTSINSGDAFAFMMGLGYILLRDYVLDGHRFVYGDVVLYLFRVMRTDALEAGNKNIPSIDQVKPLDEHDGYVLEAYIRLSDGKDPDLLKQGTSELLKLKDMFKGCLDFKVVDRLSLDTRVR